MTNRSFVAAVAVTSSTVSTSSSSTSTAVQNGNNAPAAIPPSVFKGSDRFYPSNVHHGHDNGHHQPGSGQDASPTLSHVPQMPMFPNYPHQQPQPPIYQGPPASQPPKTSITQKKKNSAYTIFNLSLLVFIVVYRAYVCARLCGKIDHYGKR